MQTIGGITLTNDMIVSGLSQSSANSTMVETTLGGSNYVTTYNRALAEVVTFTGTDSTGWQHYDTVALLLALSNTGGEFLVNVNGSTFQAVFSGEVKFDKLFDFIPNGNTKDFYSGSFQVIKLT